MSAANIGLISDCPLQRHIMQAAIESFGFQVIANSDPGRIDEEYLARHQQADVWLVILIDEDLWDDPIGELIDHAEAPILFGMGEAPPKQSRDYAKWERRLLSKLVETVGEPTSLAEHTESLNQLEVDSAASKTSRPLPHHIQPARREDPVQRAVVLAASLGGPSAVKEFLDCLPAGLPAAFVYAQHIDQNSANVLLRVLGRHAAVSIVEAQPGNKLYNGEIVIVPVDHEISFDDDGLLVFHDHPWPGPYGPSIDQVMLNVANFYTSKTYVILFSGMGNDGAIAGPLLKAYGSNIWSQSSESCASSSMPDAVADTGCVSYRGTPTELAEKLIRTIETEELTRERAGTPKAM